MTYDEIRNFPTSLRAPGHVGFHESLFRSYRILEEVKELLQQGAPAIVVQEIIEDLEKPRGEEAPGKERLKDFSSYYVDKPLSSFPIHMRGKPVVESQRGCPVCASKMVFIRGRYPNTDDREICPTCAQEKLESILEIATPNQTGTDAPRDDRPAFLRKIMD